MQPEEPKQSAREKAFALSWADLALENAEHKRALIHAGQRMGLTPKQLSRLTGLTPEQVRRTLNREEI